LFIIENVYNGTSIDYVMSHIVQFCASTEEIWQVSMLVFLSKSNKTEMLVAATDFPLMAISRDLWDRKFDYLTLLCINREIVTSKLK